MALRLTRWLPLVWLSVAAGPLAAQALDSITPAVIRRHITRLAADSMRGRATPSRELEQAARYAAAQFRRAGLVPLGDSGTFFQRYTILTTRIAAESATVQIAGPAGAQWQLGRDADWLRVSEAAPRLVSGPLVLLTGVPDSLNPFGGLDVRGAVVVHIAPMTEAGVDAPRWLFRAAARAGVAGWILVVERAATQWAELVARIAEPRTFVSGHDHLFPFPVLEMQDQSLGTFLAETGVPHAAVRPLRPPYPPIERLAGFTVRLRLAERVIARRTAPNVLALLPGADSARQEYVLVTAHLDALGVGSPIGSDSIFNGADDDAAGTAAVLEAARALARDGARPPRSIVFALFSGTERGLWGSTYYVSRPPVPLERTVAVIDVEAIGRNLKDSVAVVGADRSGLEAVVAAVAQRHAAALGLSVVGDPDPAKRLWDEGDHGLFGRRGVPTLALHNGLHGDLHRPGDEPRKIDFASTARIARFLALLAREAATPTP